MRDSIGHGRRVLLISLRLPGYCYISYTWGHTFTLLQGPNQVQTLCPPTKTPNSPGTSGIVHDALAL